MLSRGNVLINCIILEYECTVNDNEGGDEDGRASSWTLEFISGDPILIYFGSHGECDLSGP